MIQEAISNIDEIQVKKLLQSVFEKYGYDFSDYSPASIKRRISRFLINNKFQNIEELEEALINNPLLLGNFIEEITVNVTEMYRDPAFYKSLIQDVFPTLALQPIIRIWHAGCSTGEEVFSLAILLHEAGLLHKSLLYGTDLNQGVLHAAMKRTYSKSTLKTDSENYISSGGIQKLSDYYSETENTIKFHDFLSKHMVFSNHNLSIDQSFNEFNLILCRNVLIYFNRNLQDKVFKLFTESMADKSFLALGTKETLEFSSVAEQFDIVNKNNRIWKVKKS